MAPQAGPPLPSRGRQESVWFWWPSAARSQSRGLVPLTGVTFSPAITIFYNGMQINVSCISKPLFRSFLYFVRGFFFPFRFRFTTTWPPSYLPPLSNWPVWSWTDQFRGGGRVQSSFSIFHFKFHYLLTRGLDFFSLPMNTFFMEGLEVVDRMPFLLRLYIFLHSLKICHQKSWGIIPSEKSGTPG